MINRRGRSREPVDQYQIVQLGTPRLYWTGLRWSLHPTEAMTFQDSDAARREVVIKRFDETGLPWHITVAGNV